MAMTEHTDQVAEPVSEPLPCHIPAEAIRSAAKFARDLAWRSHHTEAVSDCPHCTLSFLATWAEQLLIEIGRK